MSRLDTPFLIRARDETGEIGIGDVTLGSDIDATRTCGNE
jgi:hypothetical protein